MKLRYATVEDVRTWFGGVPWNVRAIVIEHDGELLGIAGVCVDRDSVQAFSTIKDELRCHRMTMCRAAVMFGRILRDYTGTVIAVCDQSEPTSPGLLTYLGFEPWFGKVWRRG